MYLYRERDIYRERERKEREREREERERGGGGREGKRSTLKCIFRNIISGLELDKWALRGPVILCLSNVPIKVSAHTYLVQVLL